jgi:hypothetical protein
MINKAQNKQITANDTKQKFLFPEFGVTIEADSQEEALEKLEEIKNNNK